MTEPSTASFRPLTEVELVDWITESTERLAEVAALVGAREPVPACAPWTMRQLVAHVISGLSGWYTHNITHGDRPTDLATAWDAQPPLPKGNAVRLGYLARVTAEFGELIRSLDPDAACYVFQDRRTNRGWVLRAATECAIHTQDAEAVLGAPTPFTTDRAATSIDETLRLMWRGALVIGGDPDATSVPDVPLTIVVDDLGLAFRVTKRPGEFGVEHLPVDAVPSELTVRGPSTAVLPWLWGRPWGGAVAYEGDRERIEAWNLSART